MEPRNEVLDQVRDVIREWDSKKGHERCWYYPDLFKKIAELTGVQLTAEPELPSRAEFEHGCKCYQDEQYKASEEAQTEAREFMRNVLEEPVFKKELEERYASFKVNPDLDGGPRFQETR